MIKIWSLSQPRQARAVKEMRTGCSARAQERIVSQAVGASDGEMEVREGLVGRGDTFKFRQTVNFH